MFKGSLVALITPFRDGKVDEKAFQDFVAWQIAEGTHGLVPCGTTGESPTLSHEEHDRVIELCIEVAKSTRTPVMAGTGSNSTEEAIRLTRHAKKAGADAALIVTPYYNKPTQEGLYLHYKAIHDAVDLPIYIYNIPGRSVINMTVETMARLAKLPNIVGVKCATGDIQRPLLERVAIGDEWIQLSGDDGMALPYLAQGGQGCISVSANVAPRALSEMHVAWQKGDVATAMKINRRLMPLHESLFVETSPGPVKYAASLIGKGTDYCRLPLAPTLEPTQARVKAAMTNAGLLN
ncbi:4-hydroxy-tetrahydrodipicolinate synthase [Stella humosa]|uniref:4-hydroxy-tetrahydrodipicolinate synthase n=1 Tax=Stella humosa TaxID=94 RepID=A0A3N1KYI4_9PROT|nr:4-hydroxy-tetrahydrodipicolinate synthase [Stella humosa]ROP83680.1 4-hydroxy-tetrahydrodipicolinate synthase [Stella humosa]BBK33047.1 4-hydroxy-tetrahydrodipicolinate synthase [Stella humosa]